MNHTQELNSDYLDSKNNFNLDEMKEKLIALRNKDKEGFKEVIRPENNMNLHKNLNKEHNIYDSEADFDVNLEEVQNIPIDQIDIRSPDNTNNESFLSKIKSMLEKAQLPTD